MKRNAVFLTLLLALPVSAATEKWWEAYSRGVAAVNARNYKAAVEAFQKSVAEMPNEGVNVRAGKQLITYVPHFWLGIARFNLGDTDGALREWRASEDQGVVARTEYYARMKDWVARAQAEKQRDARSDAAGAKKAADTAISRALEVQLEALAAGGDRAESYQSAQRKLIEARAQFSKAGTDIGAYKSAEQTAQQAAVSFRSAIEEGKKLKAERKPPAKKPATIRIVQVPVTPSPATTTQPAAQQPAAQQPVQTPTITQTTAPPPAMKTDTAARAVLTQAEVNRRIAEQEARRRRIEASAKKQIPPTPAAMDVTATALPQPQVDLRPAFRAYVAGDLASSEQQLTTILIAQPAAAEAYLLRGCARYTRAILSRAPEQLLQQAAADFRAALQRNASLQLDRSAFSPKLIAFFEQVRSTL